MRLLHIVPQIDAGGPSRGLLALGQQTAALALPIEHRVVALSRQANGAFLAALARRGMFPLLAPRAAAVAGLVAESDVVLIHFWTAPALAELLAAPLPECRLALWIMVSGLHLPQRILPEHVAFADKIVTTGPSAVAPAADLIPGLADFARLEPRARETTRDAVTFIGTINRAKLHPDFFALSDRIEARGWRFPLVGGPLDAWFAPRHAAARDPGRYEIPGFVEDIAAVLARTAVFGYPAAHDTYATSDKSVQEAMWMGVPPAMIAGRGAAFCVADGETGRIAATDAEYPDIVADLLDRPAERRRLGDAAAAHARKAFDPATNTRRLHAHLAEMTAHPKRGRAPLFAPPAGAAAACPGAYRLARGFGEAGLPLVAALADPGPAAIAAATNALAALPPNAASAEGGVFHFRNQHPDDFALRLWTGVLMTAAGRADRAAAEFASAAALGAPPDVADGYRSAAAALGERAPSNQNSRT